jgi:hypothetical protein
MCAQETSASEAMPNGSGAAAILAAGLGAFALAAFAIAADRIPWFHRLTAVYKPTGPLSGVTTLAVIVWLVAWAALEARWRKKTVRAGAISAAALTLLGVAVLLTFPPLAELF